MPVDCSVILPVGPGHAELAQVGLHSVILAAEEDRGPFDEVFVICGDDTRGVRGRSATRNGCVAGPQPWQRVFGRVEDNARAYASEWLFFLDADDLMCSAKTYGESPFGTLRKYTDDHDAVWGTIHELHPNGQVLKRKQIERITTYPAYVKAHPALSCQMGHFVRRAAFEEIGGFNEELDVAEDIDLYLREWRRLRCIKQSHALFLNRRGAHVWMQPAADGSGRQVHTGRDWSLEADRMLREARREL